MAVTTWIVLGVLWSAFFLWYTNLRGPLRAEEIEAILARRSARGDDPAAIANFRAFLEGDTGRDFVMVNLIDFPAKPKPVAGLKPGETTQEVMGRYMAHMWPQLLKRACHPVLMGKAAADAVDIWGIDGAEHWSQCGLMRYRSRRDLVAIGGNPEFQGPHEFKIAAMTKTIAFPASPWIQLGDPRLVLGLLFFSIGMTVLAFS